MQLGLLGFRLDLFGLCAALLRHEPRLLGLSAEVVGLCSGLLGLRARLLGLDALLVGVMLRQLCLFLASIELGGDRLGARLGFLKFGRDGLRLGLALLQILDRFPGGLKLCQPRLEIGAELLTRFLPRGAARCLDRGNLLQLGLQDFQRSCELFARGIGGFELSGAVPEVGFEFLLFGLPGAFFGDALRLDGFGLPVRRIQIAFKSRDGAGQIVDARREILLQWSATPLDL